MPPRQASASERTTRSNSPGQVVLAPNSADRVGLRETAPTRAPVAMRWAAVIRAHLAGGGIAVLATHIDLGLTEAAVLDVTPYRAKMQALDDFDEAFL